MSVEVGKQLAWALTAAKIADFGQARQSVRDFYSGSRAIADPVLIQHVQNLPPVSDWIYNHNLLLEFESAFTGWILSHKSNRLTGLEGFVPDISQGATQAFDSFYIRWPDRHFKFFQGEYFYHMLLCTQLNKPWSLIQSIDQLKTGDALILSVPFCDTGSQFPDLESVLNHCDLHGVPVLLDCAYYTIASGIQINLNHECISAVVFSLSKTFPIAHARVGMRYTRLDFRDGQKLHSQINYNNRLTAGVGLSLISAFPSDYIVDKYRPHYVRLTERLGLRPGNSIMFAEGDATWDQYSRKSLLAVYGLDLDYRLFRNRICLTNLLNNPALANQILDHI